jgi:hypothetical protein
MTLNELDEALRDLEQSRKTAEQELEAAKNRRGRIEQLEQDKNALLRQYLDVAPEALNALTPEQRHHVYKLLRLDAFVHPDEHLEVSGTFGREPSFSNQEMVSTYLAYFEPRLDAHLISTRIKSSP